MLDCDAWIYIWKIHFMLSANCKHSLIHYIEYYQVMHSHSALSTDRQHFQQGASFCSDCTFKSSQALLTICAAWCSSLLQFRVSSCPPELRRSEQAAGVFLSWPLPLKQPPCRHQATSNPHLKLIIIPSLSVGGLFLLTSCFVSVNVLPPSRVVSVSVNTPNLWCPASSHNSFLPCWFQVSLTERRAWRSALCPPGTFLLLYLQSMMSSSWLSMLCFDILSITCLLGEGSLLCCCSWGFLR